jgi:hypothetical protein
MKLVFTKHVILSKLADELFNSGLVSPLTEEGTPSIQGTEGQVYIYVPDDTPQEVIAQITSIVEAHNPTPPLVYDPVDDEKVALAEAVIDLETRLSALEAKLNA